MADPGHVIDVQIAPVAMASIATTALAAPTLTPVHADFENVPPFSLDPVVRIHQETIHALFHAKNERAPWAIAKQRPADSESPLKHGRIITKRGRGL